MDNRHKPHFMYKKIIYKKWLILREPENYKLCVFKIVYIGVVAIKQHKTSESHKSTYNGQPPTL